MGEDRDNIVGVLLAKDLLRLISVVTTNFDINEFMRPTVFVPESNASMFCCGSSATRAFTWRSSWTSTAASRAW